MGDIIWYNDVLYCQQLSSPAALDPGTTTSSATNGSEGEMLNELASILLACESFDILRSSSSSSTGESGYNLSFSTYAGHAIEFQVTIPGEMILQLLF